MSDFLNGLQAASNAVAGNVAGPVDILALLLRKAGIPVPEDAIGGSNWMTQKGLMAPVRQGASQVIGETAGLLGPAMVTQFGPQIARGLLSAGDNLAAPRTLNPQTGAVVWHGSNANLDDVPFDLTKVGSGHGAQTEGWGAYLTGSRKNAQRFGRNVYAAEIPDGELSALLDYNKTIATQAPSVREAIEWRLAKTPNDIKRSADLYAKEQYRLGTFGNKAFIDIYKTMPKDSDDIIKWTATLPHWAKRKLMQSPDVMTGQSLVRDMTDKYGAETTARMLQRDGIKGAVMKDAGDWQSTLGSTNYVLWDQELLKNAPFKRMR